MIREKCILYMYVVENWHGGGSKQVVALHCYTVHSMRKKKCGARCRPSYSLCHTEWLVMMMGQPSFDLCLFSLSLNKRYNGRQQSEMHRGEGSTVYPKRRIIKSYGVLRTNKKAIYPRGASLTLSPWSLFPCSYFHLKLFFKYFEGFSLPSWFDVELFSF